MNCKDAQYNINRWLDGELEEKLSIQLEEHLKTCVICKKEEWKARELNGILSMAYPNKLPSGFDNKFWEKEVERRSNNEL
ncbi:MAG: zf-HC2 domain-containing protein [Deltaproteobacteria bacterium]|nr:MAG: zf-HC2 domain-containing protein [Deltaproteobacteria bacterium]